MSPILLISIAAFLGVSALIGAVVFLSRDFASSTAEDRLEALTGRKDSATGAAITKEELLREGVDGLSGAVSGLSDQLGRLSSLFEQADSPIQGEAFLALSALCAVLGGAASWAAHSPAPLIPVAAFLGAALPWGWLLWRRRRRFKTFASQLPDALELIGRALRSGHSLSSGMHLVVDEMPPPISAEFGMVYEEQNLGVPIEGALKSMLERVPNMDLKLFVTAVVIQRQAGGDLAEILDKISYIIRERFKIMGQVQALTGEGRISGVVLLGLPVALFLAVYHLNPDYVMLLFDDPLGRKMMTGAIVLQILGAVAIKKIVNIKI